MLSPPSLSGVSPSAINTSATHASSVDRMNALSAKIAAVQEEVATGRRVNRPSDDPVAAARAATLRRTLTASAATMRSIDSAGRRLRAGEITLAAMSDLALRARELALAGSNATLNQDNRAVIAAELREITASLTGLAETRDADGVPLFAGNIGIGPTYAPDASGVLQWQGQGQPPAIAAGGSLIATGLTGPQAFGATTPASLDRPEGTSDIFATMAALATALEEPDPARRQTAIESRLTELQTHGNRLIDAQALIGTRAGRLDAEATRLTTQDLSTEIDLSRLEDTDMASSIARLQRLLNVLDAAQASFARTANQSLFDLLR